MDPNNASRRDVQNASARTRNRAGASAVVTIQAYVPTSSNKYRNACSSGSSCPAVGSPSPDARCPSSKAGGPSQQSGRTAPRGTTSGQAASTSAVTDDRPPSGEKRTCGLLGNTPCPYRSPSPYPSGPPTPSSSTASQAPHANEPSTSGVSDYGHKKSQDVPIALVTRLTKSSCIHDACATRQDNLKELARVARAHMTKTKTLSSCVDTPPCRGPEEIPCPDVTQDLEQQLHEEARKKFIHMFAPVISTVIMKAYRDVDIPLDHKNYTKEFLSLLKDDDGNTPPNIAGILRELDSDSPSQPTEETGKEESLRSAQSDKSIGQPKVTIKSEKTDVSSGKPGPVKIKQEKPD